MKSLYLVDVSSLFFRAFYAIRSLSNSKGMPTNALYGFLTMLLKLVREKKPDLMVCCFDTKEPCFREEIYPEYKAHRDEMPADLVPQVPYIKKIVEALGISMIEKPGYEADDLIATLTRIGRAHHTDVVIVSSDKDLAQLVGPHVSMYDTMKDVYYNTEGVIAKWGVKPQQVIDYLSLVGDTSDNIPGVDGVGGVTAGKLLAQFESLEDLYARVDEVKNPRLKEKLIAGKDSALLSQKLVTLESHAPIPMTYDHFKLKPFNRTLVRDLLEELEFHTLTKKIFSDDESGTGHGGEEKSASNGSEALTTQGPAEASEGHQGKPNSKRQVRTPPKVVPASAEDLRSHLKNGENVWVVITDREILIANEAHAFQMDDDPARIGSVLLSKEVGWKGYDLKEIWKTLKVQGSPRPIFDIKIAAYILTSLPVESFTDAVKDFLERGLPELPSGADFLKAEWELEARLEQDLKSSPQWKVFEQIDLPLVPILYAMESRGVLIDPDVLMDQSRELDRDCKRLEQNIFEAAGETFNLASPQQLSRVLFGKLKMPPGKKTKTGYSTDSDVLEGLAPDYPIALKILEYRELAKLKSTYVDSLPQLIDPATGRIHTSFNQTITSTGRLSSTNPNLQNIPIRTERGRGIRKAFIAPEGRCLVAADYSQIELRILAHITSDPGLVAAFRDGQDIHAATAAEVFGVALKNVTSDQRRMAKAVNFGLAYGMSAFGLAGNLGIPRKDAAEIINRYFARFPKVKDYMTETVETAAQKGYVETIYGRRRYVEELKSKNPMVRRAGERAAINAPIQGAAADIVKMAMVEIERNGIDGMVLQVHDELVFECPVSQCQEFSEKVQRLMESVVQLKVPLLVNVAYGSNWEEAHG